MLRPRPAAAISGGDDLLVRMHLLPRLRHGRVARQVPELRRRAGGAPAPAGGEAGEVPRRHRARAQARRLREGRMSEAFLESYGGQSTDELIALAGKYRIDSLVL